MTNPPEHPRTLLEELHRDRAVLSARAQTPRWFPPAVGLVLASWVASPAVDSDRGSAFYLFVVTTVLLLLGAARQATGVRYAGLGLRGWLVGTALMASTLGLFSASLALVSLDLAWWVFVPALAMLGAGWAGVHAMTESARKAMREV